MSVFRPMSTSGSPDRKKALLDRLMEQYQEAAGRAAGLGSLAGAAGSTPFRMAHPFGGLGLHVGQPHGLPPELMAQLGPGGIGIPQPPHIGGPTNPHAGGSPIAAGGPPGLGGGFIEAAPPASLNAPVASGGGLPVDPFSGVSPAQIVQRIAQNRVNVYASPYHSGIGAI